MPTLSRRYTARKVVKFEASHQLEGLPEDHKCSRLHGHNYVVEVEISSAQLDKVGFVMDFGVISKIIKDRFDHRHLNDKMVKNTTAENIAEEIHNMLCTEIFQNQDEGHVFVEAVTVWETPECSASFRMVVSE